MRPAIIQRLATESTPLWHATEFYLNQMNVDAPFDPILVGDVCYTRGESADLTNRGRYPAHAQAAAVGQFGSAA